MYIFFPRTFICLPPSKIDEWALSQRETMSLWKHCQREKLKGCHKALVSELEWKTDSRHLHGSILFPIFQILLQCSEIKTMFVCPVLTGNCLTLWSFRAAHWLMFLGVETQWDLIGLNVGLLLKPFLQGICGNLLGSLESQPKARHPIQSGAEFDTQSGVFAVWNKPHSLLCARTNPKFH